MSDDKGAELQRRRAHKRIQKIVDERGGPKIALADIPTDQDIENMIVFLMEQLPPKAIAGMLAGSLLQMIGEEGAKEYVLVLAKTLGEGKKS